MELPFWQFGGFFNKKNSLVPFSNIIAHFKVYKCRNELFPKQDVHPLNPYRERVCAESVEYFFGGSKTQRFTRFKIEIFYAILIGQEKKKARKHCISELFTKI
ncbi:hypothetical protein A8C56_03370 [Niabella ginsenosidivorans]|uniref:Uncharacterized protein n=1 Tax=Niabella ginsenosidivorans TaxID=1176587 RepID=A0A1A9I0E0_9BACT|nr:hypothetical protein A8C56_03370 [Niabella ginsenosidivorans]